MIYAPRGAIEAELDALRRGAADRNVEVHLFRHVGFGFLEEPIEHAKLAHRLRLHLRRRARLEGRSAGNQE